jgi:hypothetical protein
MTTDIPDDGISPFQKANLLPGCRAVLPVKSGVQLALVVGGKWTKGSKVEVQLRSRTGSTLLTMTENTLAPLPLGTRSVVLTPLRAVPGFSLEARIFPVPTK